MSPNGLWHRRETILTHLCVFVTIFGEDGGKVYSSLEYGVSLSTACFCCTVRRINPEDNDILLFQSWLTAELRVSVDNNQRYFCSASTITQCRTCFGNLTPTGPGRSTRGETMQRLWFFARYSVKGQQRGEGETRDGAHYASVTLKVRDRKEAGGHSPKREQDSVVLLNRLQP